MWALRLVLSALFVALPVSFAASQECESVKSFFRGAVCTEEVSYPILMASSNELLLQDRESAVSFSLKRQPELSTSCRP